MRRWIAWICVLLAVLFTLQLSGCGAVEGFGNDLGDASRIARAYFAEQK